MEVVESLPRHAFNLGFHPTECNADGPVLTGSEFTAATKLQKVYRSYRTRRRLADSAVVAEELWWQVLDYARLNLSTVSFFDYSKPEMAISRWNRVSLNASKVGQGLSKDGNALKLAFQHWIEAIDPRHRYGHNLHVYYDEWCKSEAGQPFFYWLDIGDGKDVDLKECPRSLLREQCVKYLGPSIWAYSGHYRPSNENLKHFLAFLEENGTDLNMVKIHASSNEDYYDDEPNGKNVEFITVSQPPKLELPAKLMKGLTTEPTAASLVDGTAAPARTDDARGNFTRTLSGRLSGGLQSPRTDVPRKAILQRIMSKREGKSYQLGHQLSLKWCTGAGPRIGCVADYPSEIRRQALELVNSSPRDHTPACTFPTFCVH